MVEWRMSDGFTQRLDNSTDFKKGVNKRAVQVNT